MSLMLQPSTKITTNHKGTNTMSYTYIADIMSNKSLVDSSSSSDLKEVVTWANSSTLQGDTVVISEGYTGADGVVDKHDHINAWYVDL